LHNNETCSNLRSEQMIIQFNSWHLNSDFGKILSYYSVSCKTSTKKEKKPHHSWVEYLPYLRSALKHASKYWNIASHSEIS
jgi:hypothetical protein